MVGIIISIYAIQPPSERQTVHHVIGVPHFSPGITADTTGIRILIREKGSDRFDNKHFVSTAFTQIFHPVVKGLGTSCYILIIPFVCLNHTGSKKIQFEIFKTGCFKFINEIINSRQCSRGCRVHTAGTI